MDLTHTYTRDADIQKVLTEAVINACRDILHYEESINIEGLIGITIDDSAIMLISLKKKAHYDELELDNLKEIKKEEVEKNNISNKCINSRTDSLIQQDSTDSNKCINSRTDSLIQQDSTDSSVDDSMSVSGSPDVLQNETIDQVYSDNFLDDINENSSDNDENYNQNLNNQKDLPSIEITLPENDNKNNPKKTDESDEEETDDDDDENDEEEDDDDADNADVEDDDKENYDSNNKSTKDEHVKKNLINGEDDCAKFAKRFKQEGLKNGSKLINSAKNKFSKTFDMSESESTDFLNKKNNQLVTGSENSESTDTSSRLLKSRQWANQKAKSLSINKSNSSFEQDNEENSANSRRGSRIVSCNPVNDDGPGCSVKKRWIKDRVPWISLDNKDGKK